MKSNLNDFLKKIKFEDPSEYDFDADKKIDQNIKETLKNINKSSWCWTLYSCEGHVQENVCSSLPYFVFVVKKKHISVLLGLIFNTLSPEIDKPSDLPLLNSKDIILSWGFTDDKYAVITAHWSSNFLNDIDHPKLHKDLYDMSFKILEAKL